MAVTVYLPSCFLTDTVCILKIYTYFIHDFLSYGEYFTKYATICSSVVT
jgi:hypothetical protein